MRKVFLRWLLYIFSAGLCLVMLYPILNIVLFSFRSGSLDEFSFENYRVILRSFRFQAGLAFSLLYTVSITLMQYIFGVSGGFVLAKFKFRGREVLYYAYLLCMIIPFNVIVLPQYILLKGLNLFDTVWAIILPGGFGSMGVFFYRQFIKQLPNEIFEAGQVDGASQKIIFSKLLVPMLKECSCAFIVICFCMNWNAVDPAIVYLYSAKIQPLSIALKGAFINAPAAFFAPAAMYMIPPVLVYMLFSEELINSFSTKDSGIYKFSLFGKSTKERRKIIINKKKIFVSISIFLVSIFLITPTVVWLRMPKVETRAIISLTKEGTLLPKSVVELGESPHVFQLVPNGSFWNDGYIAQRIDVQVLDSDQDSVIISEYFNPAQEFIILDDTNLYEGIHVRRK